ncbi:MAG: hypothetical protein K9M08_20515 [Pirellula sp.]|nr:hypothetical protein [Pirellula sp.]
MLSIHVPSIVENSSIESIVQSAERVQQGEMTQEEEPNLALALEEIATLSTLMNRYDLLLVEMDNLNRRLEELLKLESPTRKIES